MQPVPGGARVLGLLLLGGSLGTVARYAVSAALARPGFPWGTATVNFVGSVALGLLMFGGALRGVVSAEARLFVGVAFLGAFTTMSTFAFETAAFMDDGRWGNAALNFLLNPVACIGGALVGRAVARWAWGA